MTATNKIVVKMFAIIMVWTLLMIAFVAKNAHCATLDVQTGADYWGVPSHQVRYLPNYSPPNEFHNLNPYFKAISRHEFNDSLAAMGKVRYSQVDGLYIDQASIEYKTELATLRAGVLPYRATWCEYLNFNSVWIKEPDAFCGYKALADSVNSGSGVQAVSSLSKWGWVFDGQIGYYDNTLYKQSKTQGSVYALTGSFKADTRYGLNINALELETGNQIRISYIKANQTISGSAPRHYQFDTVFAGVEINQITDLSIKLTATSYIGSQLDKKASLTDYMATSLSTSVVYKLTDSDQLAVGITKYRNRTQYLLANFTQPLDVPLYSLGYRHDFNDNLFIKAQIMQSSSVYHQINKPETKANGVAAGVGIGVTF